MSKRRDKEPLVVREAPTPLREAYYELLKKLGRQAVAPKEGSAAREDAEE